MRKQLILLPPDDVDTEEVTAWMKYNNQSSVAGYPIVIPPGWNYTIEKISDPIAIVANWDDSNK
mgnify:CR=1 FL=1